ncbi:HLJ1_G0028400.mRNA.1.CDS.1 [Saccharomyces cerevisiae]|nr:HLJ1_G0028400.mRNA.1.CDS.1 [Saccharomyces cerevisiae]
MIIIFIELCRIADSLLWIPKSSRRTSSIFYIPNIIAFINNGIPTINFPDIYICSLPLNLFPVSF